MNNPFVLSSEERRRQWREFRLETMDKDMSDMEHIQLVVDWWSPAPISARTIDPYDPVGWPTGWELVVSGDVCEFSIALGMEQTLLLREGRWTSDRVELALIVDDDNIKLVVLIDKRWMLNYYYGEIFDFSTTDKVSIVNTYYFTENHHGTR